MGKTEFAKVWGEYRNASKRGDGSHMISLGRLEAAGLTVTFRFGSGDRACVASGDDIGAIDRALRWVAYYRQRGNVGRAKYHLGCLRGWAEMPV